MNHAYELHPTAPLVLGTGRPANFGLGGETLSFLTPSVAAGAMRAAAATAAGGAPDPHDDAVRNLEMGPPILLWQTLKTDGSTKLTPLLPRPADALGHGDPEAPTLVPLVPVAGSSGASGLPHPALQLPAPKEAFKEKPTAVPAWWSLELMTQWLIAPGKTRTLDASDRVLNRLAVEQRTHVGIADAHRAAAEGLLFRTGGLDFGGRRKELDEGRLERFVIGLRCGRGQLAGAQRRVGGEGRLCHVRSSNWHLQRPQALQAGIAKDRLFRVVLVSPAVFENGGWRPDWIDGTTMLGAGPGGSGEPKVQLVSAVIERAVVHSGWRPATPGQPAGPGQPVRVVPAGSVYWFKALRAMGPDDWWLRSLCTGDWAGSGWGFGVWGFA